MFFAHNRFAFGNLQPGTTYWFWIVAHELGPNKEDSDKTWFSFTTPEENLAPNVILYKDFDDFWFRGCPISRHSASEVTNAQIGANIDPDDPNCPAATGKIVSPVNSTDSFFNYVGSAIQPRSGESGQTVGSMVGRRHLRHELRRRRLSRLAGASGYAPRPEPTALDRIRFGLHQRRPS